MSKGLINVSIDDQLLNHRLRIDIPISEKKPFIELSLSSQKFSDESIVKIFQNAQRQLSGALLEAKATIARGQSNHKYYHRIEICLLETATPKSTTSYTLNSSKKLWKKSMDHFKTSSDLLKEIFRNPEQFLSESDRNLCNYETSSPEAISPLQMEDIQERSIAQQETQVRNEKQKVLARLVAALLAVVLVGFVANPIAGLVLLLVAIAIFSAVLYAFAEN